MSGKKQIDYRQTAAYKAQQEARKKNRINSKRARELVQELEAAIEKNKQRHADRLAKEQLDKAENLLTNLNSKIGAKNEDRRDNTGVVNSEKNIIDVCDELESAVIKAASKEQKWSAPIKMSFELERKISGQESAESGEKSLMEKWSGDEFTQIKHDFIKVKSNVDDYMGEPEELFYELRDLDSRVEKLIQAAKVFEGQDVEREMLIEIMEEALLSDELAFEQVRIREEEVNNPRSALLLEAWRPNDTITMRFELGETSESVNTEAAGLLSAEHEGGCGDAYDIIRQKLEQHGLADVRIMQDGQPVKPYDEIYKTHPGIEQEFSGEN